MSTTRDTSRFRQLVSVHAAQPMSDGAGVRLKRSLGAASLSFLDPFLLLDEFRSDDPNDYIAGFPPHPHRGFETVTYMLAGSMEHQDSVGNRGLLGPGSVQWMTAGRGIIHSEMPKQEDGLMWGFQLWVNLPAAQKMTAPRYQDIPGDQIPQIALEGGGVVRVICGEAMGVAAAVTDIAVNPLYLDLRLPARGQWSNPVGPSHNALVYAYEGAGVVGGQALKRGQLGVLGPGDAVRFEAGASGLRTLLIAGKPTMEPVARYGPFVMNTREEIMAAIHDYQRGNFAN